MDPVQASRELLSELSSLETKTTYLVDAIIASRGPGSGTLPGEALESAARALASFQRLGEVVARLEPLVRGTSSGSAARSPALRPLESLSTPQERVLEVLRREAAAAVSTCCCAA